MRRFILSALIVVCTSESTLAIVESVEFQATITSEKNTRPATDCTGDSTTRWGVIAELEDCGISVSTHLSEQNWGDFREFSRARTPYGWTEMLFTRRLTPPLGRSERPRNGVGIVTSLDIHPGLGAATGSMSFSLVERMLPPNSDSESAVLSLDLLGEGLDNFSTASVQVFDHDTDELLLSWFENGEPFEPNNGRWYSQELDFEDRVGHAIRFEFEAVGRTVHRSSWLAAAVFLFVPEPSSSQMVLPILLLGVMRRKRRALGSPR